jgi:hypothetical protein
MKLLYCVIIFELLSLEDVLLLIPETFNIFDKDIINVFNSFLMPLEVLIILSSLVTLSILNNLTLIDILPSTGLLIKYDPSINLIYFGFALLMITTSLSFLPYNQIWIFNEKKNCWIGSVTNRGKIQLEIEFENLVRGIEFQLTKNILTKKKL